jgi:PST family polysaccharide transporter
VTAKTSRPAFWIVITGLSQAGKFFISIIGSIVLARLLSPTDFGLMATISPLVAMADLVRDLGFTQAIIQRRMISRRQVNALFWLSMATAFAIATLLSLISPLVAGFFNEPRLTLLLIATSWSLLIGSLGALPIALLNSQLRFAAIAVVETCASVTGMATAATCAWLTHSYWSLVLANAVASITATALSLALSGWRPGRPVYDRVIGDMVRFGIALSTADIASFIARNADNLLIAKAQGPLELGLYDRAYKLMLVPLAQITWPISRVLIPVLSRQVDHQETYARTYFVTITGMMICAQPGLLFGVVFSRDVVALLLGPGWSGVAPIFTWLGVVALQHLVTSSTVWLFISQGRSKAYAALAVTNSVIAVIAFLIGLPWGALGVAVSFTLFDFAIRMPLGWWLATSQGPVGLISTLKTIVPHLAALSACAGCLVTISRLTAHLTVTDMGVCVFVTYTLYVTVLLAWSSKRATLRECALLIGSR